MWIHVPSTSSRSSPDMEESISESDWRIQALAQSALSKSKPLPAQSWLRAWKKGPWLRLLCGRMSEPSMATRGVESWIASLVDSHARRSQSPENGPVSQVSTPDSGRSLLGSFVTFDPPTFRSKTSQRSLGLFEMMTDGSSTNLHSDAYLETYPPWGSMRSGAAFPRQPSALRTSEIASSYSRGDDWPTPTASDYGSSQNGINSDRPSAGTLSLSSRARKWPTATATATDARGGARHTTTTGVMHSGTSLTDAMRQWRTLMESSARAGKWPTPATRDFKGANSETHLEVGGGRKHLDQLPNFVEHIFLKKNSQSGHPDQTNSNSGESSANSDQTLSPRFDAWLMGLPPGWSEPIPGAVTNFASWEMACRRSLAQLLGESSGSGSTERSE